MKDKRLSVLLGSAFVIGILLGAAVATLILSNSHTFDLDVTDEYQMMWSAPDEMTWGECKPPDPIYKEVWYNETVIQANLTNYDTEHGYDVTVNISFYSDVGAVTYPMVKAAALYFVEGEFWRDPAGVYAPYWSSAVWNDEADLTMLHGTSGPYYFTYALISGITLDAFEDAGHNWVRFMIRFWLRNDVPTGDFHIELSVTGTEI